MKDSGLYVYPFHRYGPSHLKATKFINTVYLIHYDHLIWKVSSWVNGPEKQMKGCIFANIFMQMSLSQEENRANLLRLVCRLPQTHQNREQTSLLTTAHVLHVVEMPIFYAEGF